jgi:hypothetical protein
VITAGEGRILTQKRERRKPVSSTLTSPYRVGEGVVHLTITVGEGQLGTSTVILGTEKIAHGESIDVDVGRGPEIAGNMLVCTTAVTDILPETNHTSVTYDLTGGPQPRRFVQLEDIDPDGTIVYLAVFTFTQ